MVKRWQKYDEHVEEAREIQLERKVKAQIDKESRVKHRDEISKFLKKRLEGESILKLSTNMHKDYSYS